MQAWLAFGHEGRGHAMRNLAVGTMLLAVAVSGTALAADLPVKAPVRAAPVAYSWTGCFIGVAGGGIWGRSRHISGDPGSFGLDITNDYNMSGAIAGIEYGCNWQTGSWVLGTESDFSWTNLRGGANDIAPFNTTSISSTKEHWLSTSRIRIGFLPSEQLLLFATGGLATARIEAVVDATASGAGLVSESKTRWGWTAGAGAEYALGNGWSAKADYLYVRLNNREYFNPPPVGFAVRGNVPVDEHIFRIGVNYKFTNCVFFLFGCGPVAARY
jgi:outer membrane immunogenic protein